MQFILTCSQMPTAQPAKLPYCGADAATEELLPEPTRMRCAWPSSSRKTNDCAMICATCSQPWPALSGC